MTAKHADPDWDDHRSSPSLAGVLLALGALLALVIFLFLTLPAWFGANVVNITVRP